ncbi:MAG: MSMEG_1061 family FMN-dependent PPOX-type flavoprotein [Acidimicrobiales bacterium]
MSFEPCVSGSAELRSIYREPSQVVIDKAIDHVDHGVRGFIERSPLMILATGDGHRNDASPRGGPPGFVRVLDEHRIAFGDLVGNNRIDSYRNIADHPGVGLLFVIPGLLETLRVNGQATVSTDLELRERCAIDGRVPKVVIGIDVDECFIHCGAALRRANMWDTETWPAADDRPSPAAILKAHTHVDVPAAAIEENLHAYYEHGVWEVGGEA